MPAMPSGTVKKTRRWRRRDHGRRDRSGARFRAALSALPQSDAAGYCVSNRANATRSLSHGPACRNMRQRVADSSECRSFGNRDSGHARGSRRHSYSTIRSGAIVPREAIVFQVWRLVEIGLRCGISDPLPIRWGEGENILDVVTRGGARPTSLPRAIIWLPFQGAPMGAKSVFPPATGGSQHRERGQKQKAGAAASVTSEGWFNHGWK